MMDPGVVSEQTRSQVPANECYTHPEPRVTFPFPLRPSCFYHVYPYL
jgi:hypothetical protein